MLIISPITIVRCEGLEHFWTLVYIISCVSTQFRLPTLFSLWTKCSRSYSPKWVPYVFFSFTTVQRFHHFQSLHVMLTVQQLKSFCIHVEVEPSFMYSSKYSMPSLTVIFEDLCNWHIAVFLNTVSRCLVVLNVAISGTLPEQHRF